MPPYRVGQRFEAGTVSLWCHSRSMSLEVENFREVEGPASSGWIDPFSVSEDAGFRLASMPTCLDEAVARLRLWIDEIRRPTLPELAERFDRAIEDARAAAAAAAAAAYRDWELLLLCRVSPTVVGLELTPSDESPVAAHAIEEGEGAGQARMSEPLAKVLSRFPHRAEVLSGCRPYLRGLHICFFSPMPEIIDRLSARNRSRAIALAQQEGYRLLR